MDELQLWLSVRTRAKHTHFTIEALRDMTLKPLEAAESDSLYDRQFSKSTGVDELQLWLSPYNSDKVTQAATLSAPQNSQQSSTARLHNNAIWGIK